MALRKYLLLACLFSGVMVLHGCKVTVGFKPGSVQEYVGKPLSIKQFEAFASLAPPTISLSFTENLRDLFQRQSRMKLVDDNGDLHLEGSITGYDVKPVAITSTEQAANNRLTITVKVKCVNKVKENADFEQTFSRFADFDSNQDLSSVEDALIEEISDQLSQDIFNRSIGDW